MTPQAQPLVLLPGLMCDRHVWEPLYPHWPTAVLTQVIDYGVADSIAGMAQLVLDQVPGRFSLAGHSMGGRVAMEVVRMAPERVTRLALLDTGFLARPAGDDGALEAAKRYALLQVAQTEGVPAMAQAWVQGMVHPDRLRDKALIDSIISMFACKSADIFACQIKALLNRPDASDVLRALSFPTMLLCGAQDTWSPPSQHVQMQSLVPRAQLSIVDAAGHMAPMERPEAVAQCFMRWLESDTAA